MMQARRVEHRAHMLALTPGEPHRSHGPGRIAFQPLGEIGLGPGAGDPGGAVLRADAFGIGLDDGVDGGGIDQPLAGQDRLQGTHAGVHWIEVVVVMIMRHEGLRSARAC